MQIFNAKKNGINIFLDNSEVLTINPGEVSKPFMGSVNVVTQLLALGQPDELAIIVTSSYEMDILRVKNASLAYMFNSVEAAKAKLLDGKDLTPSPTTVTMAEHEKVKKVLADITAQRDELQKVAEDLNKKLEVAPSTKLLHEIDDKNKEIAELNDKVTEITNELESLKADYNTVTSERDNSRAESDQLQAKVQELDKLVKELRSQLEEGGAGTTQLLDPKDSEEYKKLANEFESTKEQVKSYQEVNEKLGNDNKQLNESVEVLKKSLETREQEVLAEEARRKKAENALSEKESELTELQGKYDELTSNSQQLPDPKDSDEYKALVAENEALKADGAKLVEQFKENTSKLDSVKTMLKTCMDKFNITYVDGEFKMLA
jgi:chromosome segregation ATPase